MPLRRSVQLPVETVTYNTAITSQPGTVEHITPLQLGEEIELKCEAAFLWVHVCVGVLVLTELALLGLGHGRPVPGPLHGK